MANNKFVCTFPGGADAGSFSIGDRSGVNGVGIIIVEKKCSDFRDWRSLGTFQSGRSTILK